MTYKEFLQALADAYKITTIESDDAFMCLVLAAHCRESPIDERTIALASGINWDVTKEHATKLKRNIWDIENIGEKSWLDWAKNEFPTIKNHQKLRAHWLQIQADNA